MRPRIWLAMALATLAACEAPPPPASLEDAGDSAKAAATGIRFLGTGDGDGFARATEPRALSFPADHGSHDAFRTEWWYFTGNLDSAGGAHFGFELTFFRIALRPEPIARDSAWATNQVFMAHFALTDVEHARFSAAERFARGALGLAGASAEPFKVWVQDWRAEGQADARSTQLELVARDRGTSLELELASTEPPVAQGDRGLDAKGPEPGNASFYYSMPRLSARGSIEVDGVRSEVSGTAWMDREWSTSALSPGVVGWDWFALQLADGTAMMYYRLRQSDGEASPFSGGTILDPDSVVPRRLAARDVELTPVREWRSPKTGVRYPVAWRMVVPSEDIDIDVVPYLDDQEVALSVRYWEGAVRVTGRSGASSRSGSGYLELAGY